MFIITQVTSLQQRQKPTEDHKKDNSRKLKTFRGLSEHGNLNKRNLALLQSDAH